MSVTSPSATPVHPSSPEFASLLARIAEGAEERERTQIRPHKVIDWLREAGFGQLRIPVEEGGAGLSVQELFAALIALAEADSNWRTSARALRVRRAAARQPGRVGTRAVAGPRQQRRDHRHRAKRAERQDGRRAGAGDAGRAGPGRRRLPADGRAVLLDGLAVRRLHLGLRGAPDDRLAGILVPADREGVELVDDWDGFGQRLTGTGTTRFDDVFVAPDEFRTGARPEIRCPRR